MNAWFLRALFDSVYVLALAVWVGSGLFVSFAVAPAAAGERILRAMLQRFCQWGTLCGAVALPAAVGVPLSFPEYRAPIVGLQALAIIAAILLMLYEGNSLVPALGSAGDAGANGQPQPKRLQRRLWTVHAVVLLIGIGLLVAFANRPAPRTSGIVELSPQERAQRAAEALREKAERRAPDMARPAR